ncbi:hypothetical protein [Sphingomonas sp. BK580]|uniref:hypothetical protein n=1 Tax=Sphingomonas sp. BK580 TaxID=2586972 RepID=UPI0016130781|nr:hypothetical protein [Sphingomonas sp. BK580]MBB3695690.1 hypothetical protein [Sphingomonas sp. BK580]
MLDELRSLDEFESEDFDLGMAGEQEGYMAAEAGSYEGEGDGFDQFAEARDPLDGSGEFEFEFESFGLGEFEGAGGDGEYDRESEFEFEGEFEGDEFLGKLWSAAKKVGKVVAPLAKKFAPQIGSVIGGALGGPAGAAIGGRLGGFVQQLEAEDEGESEDEMNARADIPATEDQLAEAVALAASRGRAVDAQSLGSQVTIFLGSRAPLPVKAVLPVLSKASGDVARVLVSRRDPRARALVRTLPTIQRRTVATLTHKARRGKPVTPRIAARVMAKHAQRTLSSPQAITRALAGNAAKKRSLDRKAIARAER